MRLVQDGAAFERYSAKNRFLELTNEKVILIVFFGIEKHIATWTVYFIITLKANQD